MQFHQVLLYPFALCYGLIVWIRNLLFDLQVLPSEAFPVPVINVGNLSVGGTGKTPQIEYLIRLLSPKYFTATLSRGYGRKSEGFMIVSTSSEARITGDEPLQFARKFPEIKVAVDERRRRGIRLMLEKFPNLDVVLLDDAYQHRPVKPGFNILLSSYHNLYTEDFLLPSGRLREQRSGADRADIIIVTKTPKIFSPITRRRIIEDIAPHKDQAVLFTYIRYHDPLPVFEQTKTGLLPVISKILLFTGIANDYPLREHLERMCSELIVMKFPDHHLYAPKDVERIIQSFRDLPTQKKVIITTEKDAMRLKTPDLGNIFKGLPLYYIPIEIGFQGGDEEKFNNLILNYVEKSKRNR